MTKLFHNTANSDKAEIHEGIKRNYNQNDAIHNFLRLHYTQYFNAWDIHSILNNDGYQILITSVRRALNTLERNGLIKKVGANKGKMKMVNTLYQFNADKPLLCKSMPKQVIRTPEHGC